MRTQRVFVVEKHKLLREGLTQLLSQTPRITVVGASGGTGDIPELVDRAQPDVLLMDPFSASGCTLAVVRVIRHRFPALGIVALTARSSKQDVCDVLSAGVDSYVLKQDTWPMLLEGIRNAGIGSMYLSASLWKKANDAPQPSAPRRTAPWPLETISDCSQVTTNAGNVESPPLEKPRVPQRFRAAVTELRPMGPASQSAIAFHSRPPSRTG